jgi:hypothetical protein
MCGHQIGRSIKQVTKPGRAIGMALGKSGGAIVMLVAWKTGCVDRDIGGGEAFGRSLWASGIDFAPNASPLRRLLFC